MVVTKINCSTLNQNHTEGINANKASRLEVFLSFNETADDQAKINQVFCAYFEPTHNVQGKEVHNYCRIKESPCHFVTGTKEVFYNKGTQ